MDDECLNILYENVSKSFAISKKIYAESLKGWNISKMTIRGNSIGVVMSKDHEIHICITKKNAIKYGRSIIRKYLEEPISRLGYVTTIALEGSSDVQFLERLGFYKTTKSKGIVIYRIDSVKIKKDSLCHQ